MIVKNILSQISMDKNLYYCNANLDFILEKAKAAFIDFFSTSRGFVTYRYSSKNLSDILAKAEGLSLFDEKKLIIIDKFTGSLDERDKMSMKSMRSIDVEKSGFCIIILEYTTKTFAPYTNFTSINIPNLTTSDMSAEIREMITNKNIEISLPLCSKIYELCGQNIDYARNETDKLIYYCCDSGKVTADNVALIITPNIDKSIHSLTNYLSTCNFSLAVTELNSLQKRNVSHSLILATLLSSYRRLMFCALSKLPTAQLAKILGVKEYAITKSLDNAKAYSQVKLKQIVEYIAKCEYEFKSGVMGEAQALNASVAFIISLMNINK